MKIVAGPDLSTLKIQLEVNIDKEAETTRSQFITLGSGQAMVYIQKRTEAEAFKADPAIDEALIPHVVAEAAIDSVSVDDKATEIITMADQWLVISPKIESLRLQAKKEIRAATTITAARLAAQVNWASVLT